MVMNILAWIIFIGLCIKTGAILFSYFVSLFINEEGAKNLHLGLNLYDLKKFSFDHYSTLVSFIILSSALKAYMFYLVIEIFLKINFVNPFSSKVALLIQRMSYIALAIGIFGIAGGGYNQWLIKKGVTIPGLQDYLGGAAEFLFFAGIIFFIAQVFNKGIEIQSENELTI
jgi:hypothetical protein